MAEKRRGSVDAIRLHHFTVGGLGLVAYLLEWMPGVWTAAGLSAVALVWPRLTLGSALAAAFRPAARGNTNAPAMPVRLQEAVRLALLGAGLGLLATGNPMGWLPVVAASALSAMAAVTGLSIGLIPYAFVRVCLRRLRGEGGESDDAAGPSCALCAGLGKAPYGWCRWCDVSSVRSYCNLEGFLALGMLVAIAFAMLAPLEAAVARIVVALTVVGLVAIALAIAHEARDLVLHLERLEDRRLHTEQRCRFLKRLAQAKALGEAAEEVVEFVAQQLGARRVSLMLAERGKLRILASRGIPADVAQETAVPIGERICGTVFASGGPVVLDEQGGPAPAPRLGLDGQGSAACYPVMTAPLETAQRQLGVLNVTNKPGGRFSAQDHADLAFISESAAISLASQLDRRELEHIDYGAIQTLARTVEAKDAYTHGHSERVKAWAVATGKAMGFSERQLRELSRGAEVHDIGKVAIPDDILHAPRELTSSEWALIREHPQRGVKMVEHLAFLRPSAPVIMAHHERVDGNGYPLGLAGDDIPLAARIAGVIDAYDAMTSVRPYREPLSHEAAAAELQRCAGSQFDPACVKAFLKELGTGTPEAHPEPAEPALR